MATGLSPSTRTPTRAHTTPPPPLQLIGFFFEYLQHEVHAALSPRLLLLPGSAAFLLASLGADGGGAEVVLAPHGFPGSTHLALFAINNNRDVEAVEGGSHWSLLAWAAADGAFRHYDSAGGINAAAAARVAAAAAAALPGGSSKVVQQPMPQQMNGWDCGLYVLALARLLCGRYAADGDAMRFEIAGSEVGPASVGALRNELHDLIAAKVAAAAAAGGGS